MQLAESKELTDYRSNKARRDNRAYILEQDYRFNRYQLAELTDL